MTDYQQVLDELVAGKRQEYEVTPVDAFEFQRQLRTYEKRQDITGRALRGGTIIYRRQDLTD